ncbi:MAG: hypothetical protein Q7L07_19415, partial [Pseudohongiella sp.]|nr:hypothetical protein [Pseudohongiella sp.]
MATYCIPNSKALALALCSVVLSVPVLAETESTLNLSANYHSNVPNALSEPNVFGDSFVDLNYRINRFFVTSPGNRLSIGAEAGARQYRHTQGLESANVGVGLAYSHRVGLGPYAPRYNLGLSVNRVEFSDQSRDSWVSQLSAEFAKRLSPAWLLTMGINARHRNAGENQSLAYKPTASGAVFNQSSREFLSRLEYTMLNAHAIRFGYRFRDGDIDASSPPGTPLLPISKAIAFDRGIGGEYVAYLLEARTQGLSLEWSMPLATDTGLTLGYERLIARAGQGNKYFNYNLRAELNLRF